MKLKASLFATIAIMTTANGEVTSGVIDITGSTAARTAVDSQIKAILSGETFAYNGGTGIADCTRGVYSGTYDADGAGTDYTPGTVKIRVLWTGSAAGVRDVANAPVLDNLYLLSNVATGASPGTNYADGASLAPASTDAVINTVSEIGFSDVFQSSTEHTTNTLVQEDSVGVIQFKFFKNDDSDDTITPTTKDALKNITPPLARALWTGIGELKLSLFTGNSTHTVPVYATGRNNQSGTRITELAETGTGVFAILSQYGELSTVSGETATLVYGTGNGGFESGSGVRGLLRAHTIAGTGINANGILVSFLGFSDWAQAVAGGAEELSYNGVTYSEDAIKRGNYSFWGYLHQSSMDLSGTPVAEAFYTDLKNALLASPGSGLIRINDMKVERAGDGAPITPL